MSLSAPRGALVSLSCCRHNSGLFGLCSLALRARLEAQLPGRPVMQRERYPRYDRVAEEGEVHLPAGLHITEVGDGHPRVSEVRDVADIERGSVGQRDADDRHKLRTGPAFGLHPVRKDCPEEVRVKHEAHHPCSPRLAALRANTSGCLSKRLWHDSEQK